MLLPKNSVPFEGLYSSKSRHLYKETIMNNKNTKNKCCNNDDNINLDKSAA